MVVLTSDKDASWVPPFGGFSGKWNWDPVADSELTGGITYLIVWPGNTSTCCNCGLTHDTQKKMDK